MDARATQKASNTFCWGDTGLSPLVQKISNIALDYYDNLDNNSLDSLARNAFVEQEKLKLLWFTDISLLLNLHQPKTDRRCNRVTSKSAEVKEILKDKFYSTLLLKTWNLPDHKTGNLYFIYFF